MKAGTFQKPRQGFKYLPKSLLDVYVTYLLLRIFIIMLISILNSVDLLISLSFSDISRLEKSPLLANGYNHPPHLGHMQFMQLPHPAAAHSALLSPAMPHNLARHDGSVIKNQGMPTMEAIARLV